MDVDYTSVAVPPPGLSQPRAAGGDATASAVVSSHAATQMAMTAAQSASTSSNAASAGTQTVAVTFQTSTVTQSLTAPSSMTITMMDGSLAYPDQQVRRVATSPAASSQHMSAAHAAPAMTSYVDDSAPPPLERENGSLAYKDPAVEDGQADEDDEGEDEDPELTARARAHQSAARGANSGTARTSVSYLLLLTDTINGVLTVESGWVR